ncbi:hypothetical protein WCD93_31480, partial [Klebsiella michiganensis]
LRASLASDDDGNGDALVAVKQPYAGAVARTQHQKNAEFISVTDFGAVGDGADHPLSEKFTTLKGLNFEGGGKDAGNTTAVRIREALVTVTGNSFAFFDACVMAEKGYASAELIIKGNRFAASNYAVFFGGG